MTEENPVSWLVQFTWTNLYVYLRYRSPLAVKCWGIDHCLEVSCKVDQITSAKRDWFIYLQLTDKQWFITQQFTHWSWSISILTQKTMKKAIRTFRFFQFSAITLKNPANNFDCNTGVLHVFPTFLMRENDVTPSNVMEMKIDVTRKKSKWRPNGAK